MSDGTKIEWAEASVNPITALNRESGKKGWFCSHVSDGCLHCYSEALNRRFGTAIDYRAQDRNRVEISLDENILAQPLRWRRGRRIFWNSMADTFGEFVPVDWIDQMFAIMALTPQHEHLVLTKRAARMRDYICALRGRPRYLRFNEHELCWAPYEGGWPKNIWLGVSVEDQARADERIPLLLDTPAAVRWISAEPLLRPVDLTAVHNPRGIAPSDTFDALVPWGTRPQLDWVVVGGESGSGARPFDIEWARSIITQCKAAGVPVFCKQLGARPVELRKLKFSLDPPATSREKMEPYAPLKLRDRRGGDISEFPPDLRVREYPDQERA